MNRVGKGIIGAIGAIAFFGMGAACGASGGDDNAPHVATQYAPAKAAAKRTAAAKPSAKPKAKKDPLTTHYENGLTVGVSDFKRGTTGADAVDPGKHFIAFTVKVHNGTKHALDMSMWDTECQVNEKEAEWVYESPYDDPNTTHVLPGNSFSYQGACEMPLTTHSVQIEVATDDYALSSSIFTAHVK